MVKWLAVTLAIMPLACAPGCGSNGGDISSEGKILQVILCMQAENAPPEAFKKAEKIIRSVPSKAPVMERFEWGRISFPSSQGQHEEGHCLLVLFKDPQSAYASAFWQTLRELRSGGRHLYLLHDATPHVQSTTDGHVRRILKARFTPNATREEMQTFEDAITALPKEIPAIQRLEWGAETNYRPDKPKPIDPAFRNGSYVLLFTFASTRKRDACLAHPAYKEFQGLFEKYTSSQTTRGALEYEAQVEYIAQPD